MRICIAIYFLLLVYGQVNGQITATFSTADQYFEEGESLFENQLYGLAKEKLIAARDLSISLYDERSRQLVQKAELLAAKSAYLGKFPEREHALITFYEKYSAEPAANEALFLLGNLKNNEKRYQEALDYYQKIDIDQLSKEDQNTAYFNQGYANFLLKDFNQAEQNFQAIIGENTAYYYPTYYYMAMIAFFEGEYEKAIEYFFIIENYPDYKTRIPYYIAQIYFEQKKYLEIVEYIPSQLNLAGVENVKELRHILGQTYFELGNYQEAVPHLEYYESQSRKMRKEDFYQLAFAQYQTGKYEAASKNFLELSGLNNEMGQISNNYLGDIYLKLDQKEDARTSFKNVMDYSMNEPLRQEAMLNYGKLAAELGFDRAAMSSLMQLPQNTIQYTEAQSVLGDLFESSKDYDMVINTIEAMTAKSPEILKAYQKVVLEKAILLINDGNEKLALTTLKKAAQSPVDNYYSAVIYYHIADLYHRQGDYVQSIDFLNQYFTLSRITNQLPEHVRPLNAHYLQGYNHFKTGDFTNALSAFEESRKLIEGQGLLGSTSSTYETIYADILNRLGDTHFTANRYQKAAQNYSKASQYIYPGQDYALFQLGMIRGLQAKPFEKIVVMEKLLSTIPSSSFRDDAFYQIGETNMMLNQLREAELAYENILNYKGRSNLIPRALLKLGLIAYNKGEIQKAIQYYSDVFNNNPSKTEAQESLLALEEIYIRDLGKADDYANLVLKATGYQMSNYERDSLTYVVAQEKFENGAYQEAIESYTRYIESFPKGINRLNAIFNRAESKVILKQYQNALPDYNLIIEAGQSDYYEDAIRKAALIAYNDVENFPEAFNYFSLLEDITDDEQIKYEAQLGALRSANRTEEQNASLNYAAKVLLNPLATKEDKALANYISGKINFQKENWKAAKAQLEQVLLLSDNENTAEARYLRNLILFKTNEVELAEEITLESVSNSTAYPYYVAKNLLLLADIMVVQEDYFNAKAAVEAVIENFKESEELSSEAQSKLKIINEKEAQANRIEEPSETINLDTINRNE